MKLNEGNIKEEKEIEEFSDIYAATGWNFNFRNNFKFRY